MSQRVALVTGGGRGLGRAYALELAARGAAVVVNDTGAGVDGRGADAAVARAVVAEVEAAGGRAVASTDDIATPDGARAAVATALDAFGGLDAVVNNAGILRDRSFAKLEPGDFDAVLRGHLGATAYTTLAAWAPLQASAAGRVVLTTSASGLYGQFGQANYAAAKAGMVGLMNVLKIEGARHGIGVNVIAPVAGTRMTEPLIEPALFAGLDPFLVAPVVVFLASAECDASGVILQAGGGLVSRIQVVETEARELPGDDEDVAALVGELLALDPGRPFATTAESLERVLAHAVA